MAATDLATDADLLAYVPQAAQIEPVLRGFALEDARAWIDPCRLLAKTRRTHALAAAHLLSRTTAGRAAFGALAAPRVASRTIARVATSYATAAPTPAAPGAPDWSTSSFGEDVASALASVIAPPIFAAAPRRAY